MKKLPPRLEHAEVPAPVREVLVRLERGGFEAFLVGGCVRDILLGKPPKDFDVTTRALPAEVQKLFRKVIPTGIEHGTVTVLAEGHPVEVTTYRTESDYVDGRRPSKVEFRLNVDDDLARRDFTINAMAFNPVTRDFRDPFGGQDDLALRRIRCVGSALERFGEDGLRPLRAVRFATVLAFELDPATHAAIPATLVVFRKVAVERIREELMKMLLAPAVKRGLELLSETQLLRECLPELEAEASTPGRFEAVARAPADELSRLSALLGALPDPRAVLTRLKFPNKTTEAVVLLTNAGLPAQTEGDVPTDGALRRWMARVGREHVDLGLGLAEARKVNGAAALAQRVRALRAEHPPLTAKELALDGKALMAVLGVPPSPVVGEVSRYLLEQVLENPALNTPEALGQLARTWVAGRSG